MKNILIPYPENSSSKELKNILSILPPCDILGGPWIAGGACRRILENENIKNGDIDIFFNNPFQFSEFLKWFNENAKLLLTSKLASTFILSLNSSEYTIQIINKKYYNNINTLIDDFDFSICQFVTDGNHFVYSKNALIDLQEKQLRIAPNGTISPINSISRIIKYMNYGFELNEGVFAHCLGITQHEVKVSASSQGRALFRSRTTIDMQHILGAAYKKVTELDEYDVFCVEQAKIERERKIAENLAKRQAEKELSGNTYLNSSREIISHIKVKSIFRKTENWWTSDDE